MSKSFEYERRLTDSIMVITTDAQGEMDERILLQGKIAGLLDLEKRYMDGQKQYMYNISGTQSLDQYCRIHDIGVDFLEKVIVSTSAQVEIMSKHLLNIDCLLLGPGQVFVSNKTEEILYVACPGEEEPLGTQFRQLMEYLLTKIDHKDMEAVEVAYSLYEKTLDEGYSLADLRDSVAESHARRALAKREETPIVEEEAVLEEKPAEQKKEVNPHFAKLMAFLEIWKEELFWSQSAFLAEVKEKTKTKEKKPKKSQKKSKAKPKSLSEELLVPVEKKVVAEVHPTICLSDFRLHPEGLLLYEGYEGFSDYRLLPSTKVGSDKKADLVLEKGTVSRIHATIERDGEDYYIEDLNSTNGTFVNDKALPYKEKRKLCSNDILTFADVKFRFI